VTVLLEASCAVTVTVNAPPAVSGDTTVTKKWLTSTTLPLVPNINPPLALPSPVPKASLLATRAPAKVTVPVSARNRAPPAMFSAMVPMVMLVFAM
jgi:hypothetical protein